MPQDMQEMLRRYAEVTVRVGLNLQPGQRLLIEGAPLVAAPLVRLVVESAYKAGARYVDVIWSDPQVDLIRYQHAPRDSFREYSEWRFSGALEHAERRDPRLHITAWNPDLLSGQDPELLRIVHDTYQEHHRDAEEPYRRGGINQTLVAAVEPGWAAKVFPDLPAEEREARLWEAIFASSLVNRPDPIAAWEEYALELESRRDHLQARRYAALHFVGPATDLTVGLPDRHLWLCCRWVSEAGIPFFAEMPGDEIFTLPHRDRVEGFVTVTRPRVYRGTIIEGARLEFAQGRVVKATAEQGEETLRELIATDAGSAGLGEVSLVPSSTYLAQSGRLFHNILFDENAGSHLAVGFAWPFTLAGGAAMGDDEFAAAGGNQSKVHIDIVIGCPEMDVDGVTGEGLSEPVMRAGEWAFVA